MWKQLSNKLFADRAWFFAKLSFAFITTGTLLHMFGEINGCPYPQGICKLYDFEFLFTRGGKMFLSVVLVASSALYVFEVTMLYTTLLQFGLAVLIISMHESNGIYDRATVLSVIYGGQWLAYLFFKILKNFNLSEKRMYFSIQIVAAGYTLAGIAKIKESGINWINGGENFALQVMKNFFCQYADSGSIAILQHGRMLSDIIVSHPLETKIVLSVALFMELFCLLALMNSKIQIIWGLGLCLMHAGIALLMGIGISVIAFPMLIYFINPLHLLFIIGKKVIDTFLFRLRI